VKAHLDRDVTRARQSPGADPTQPVLLRALTARFAWLLLATAASWGTLWLAVHAGLSCMASSFWVPVTMVAVVVSAWKLLATTRLVDDRGGLLHRHGLWLVVLLTFIELPQLGSFGLIDPWETHYAEVAREMLARADPISMWWGHEGWFRSKPILTFWLEALCMRALGVNAAPGEMLMGALGYARPEWAVRLPGALFAAFGCFVLYRGVAAHAGRTAGWLASIVLATAAQWALAARHALTDTPFVGALTAALGFAMLAWATPEDAVFSGPPLRFGRRSVALQPRWLLAGIIGCAVGGPIAWLFYIGIDADASTPLPRLRFAADALVAGSPGNCGLPSQPACAVNATAYPWLTPALQALVWSTALGALLWSISREPRTRRLLLLAGWLCMGLATLAKGMAGFVLPLAIAGATLLLQRRWRELLHSELLRGPALLVLLVAPWFLAALARHGRVIFDELVLRHMLGRALSHLHDTNAGADVGLGYYVWQLGYALFPWTGFVPAAALSACVRRPGRPPQRQRVLDLALVWLVLVFALFTFMRTKYHHYILPAVPALALLVGLYLAEEARRSGPARRRSVLAHGIALGGSLLIARVGADFVRPINGDLPGAARLLHLVSYRYDRAWPDELDFDGALLAFTGAVTLIHAGLGIASWRRRLIGAHLVAAILFATWLGQHFLVQLAPSFGQRHVIEAFYRQRTRVDEPLVAYQLNWKGENFYTGNHLAIFVKSGARFRRYVSKRRELSPVLYVVLETRRLRSLRGELGEVESVDVLTTRAESDKICLVRVRF
jgi:4-amino-4-deoxy-L-arabinose transferase-like glycosyltransferase